jgi:hypothetical protein
VLFFAERPHQSRMLTIDQWDIPLVLEPALVGAHRTEEVIVEERSAP